MPRYFDPTKPQRNPNQNYPNRMNPSQRNQRNPNQSYPTIAPMNQSYQSYRNCQSYPTMNPKRMN
jgi:hypothetical protein